MASSSSSSPGCWKYDVFLSFRGEDTRKTFVDHLYSALEQHRILTYKDDVTLDRGDTIGPSLLNAIEASQIALIVFSENYADSSWCLDELSHIMKCKQERGQIVMPIFYHVDPSHVRKQKRKYGEAFAKHELSENGKNKVETWKKALVDASNIAGWEPTHVANGHEAKCIKQIVDSILVKLQSSLESAAVEDDDLLVGMGTRLEDLKQLLQIGSGGVRMVGIWGVGGGGKTTLATSLYMELKISGHFDGCCFVENIREESKQHDGLKNLQEKILSTVFDKQMKVESVNLGKQTIKGMLCRRNVLIVLDDVDHLDQLKALAGCRKWFGDGSRIIITTRDEHVLTAHGGVEVSPIKLLSQDEAIRLFNKHAYREDKPVQDYKMLSEKVVSYAAGLPLALIVLGSFLSDKDKDEWLSTLARLKDDPEMDILGKLQISYDGLKDVEKELFLDIACFFRGKKKDEAMLFFDACGFHPVIGIKVLQQKALITVSMDGRFDMHDLLQEMGHHIVIGEDPNNPEKRSRLWRKEDIEDLCSRDATMENDKIGAIRCDVDGGSSNFIMLVSNMKKLRFLQVTTSFDEGPEFLSNELRYINWRSYPACLFPDSFQPRKLAVLKMERSLQKQLWKGYKYLPCLKELKLDADEIVRTPDFGGLPCLQKLILSCKSLEEIHQSLGNHSSLVSIELSYCNKLTRFPSIERMEKLETLEFYSCNALTEFPEIEASMDNLVELSLYEVGIEILPSSVGEYCTNLNSLKLNNCLHLKSIEGNFRVLKGLQKFDLSGCRQFEKLQKDLFNEDLEELCLSLLDLKSSVKKLILSHLPRFLRRLDMHDCGLKDGEIPNEIGELSNLQVLHLSSNDFTRLDLNLSQLTRLKLLNLRKCQFLVVLPELPSSLAILEADYCDSLEEVIRDEIHTNCKWLSIVSILREERKKNNIIGGQRLLETMLQGNAIERRHISLHLQGLEICKGFEPCLFRGCGCGIQLPDNWYNCFSGFLFCGVFDRWRYYDRPSMALMHVKQEEMMGDSQHVVSWKEEIYYGRKSTWVKYISFDLLRKTSWWDQTSTSIVMEIGVTALSGRSFAYTTSMCGYKLIPKTSEPTTTITDSSSFDDVNIPLELLHDSKSTLVLF